MSVKGWKIIAYSYNGDLYCVACTRKIQRMLERKMCMCHNLDGNGVCAANCTGYGPNPIFASDRSEIRDDYCGACDKRL